MNSFDQPNTVARVRELENDGCCLYLELPNGQYAVVNSKKPFEFGIGSVVLVNFNEKHIKAAPDSLWPEQSIVGVVRLKLPDRTVIDLRGGRPTITIPTRDDIDYEVGNTVEVNIPVGVTKVLAKEPLKDLDILAIDDLSIDKFRVQKGTMPETFEDFGGLQDVVDRARKLIETPLKLKGTLSRMGARPVKGVLFTGEPGTGKTLLARIIANSTESAFYQIRGPEIFSKWYGQSEEMLRRLFDAAKKQPQSIIFFDEIDSIARQRDDQSHEISNRVVAQLLTLMDGFMQTDNVIVVATSNRPQDIDVALRRPGRFDHEIDFRLPNRDDREKILQVSARRSTTNGVLPHAWIAEQTASWSAADLASIWEETIRLAADDNREVIIAEDYLGGFELVTAQKRKMKKPNPGGNSQ